MSNDTQPEIRFPGFTEAWEQRKFKDFTKISQGLQIAISNRFLNEGENRLFYITNEFLNPSSSVKYYIENAPETVIANSDDILMTRTGNTGKVVTNVHGAFHNNFFKIAYDKSKTNKLFLFYLLNSNYIQNEIRIGAGSSTIPDLKHPNFYKINVNTTSLEEQTKIGNFFKSLDDTIALHQRKLDLLKETKKGFLQKMFPKNGAKVPEIRFPGFTEDWEERRLQEVVDRYDNLRIPITASKRVAGNTPYYGANGIQGYVEGYTHDGEFILVAEDGANDLKNYPVQYVDGKVWVNNHAHVIQAKENLADNMFLMNAIRSINIEPFLVGGGRAKLNADVLMKLEVIIPLKSEQQKIGAFFKQLDDIITLHQRKLDLLKETKKGFLQKMFV
ncbi:restriction endonuclease subunit S [Enterococcus faecalis]|uniref:restriction endonuclease subunit S n=1 Tax=Enterococcus TaxID=1350 RepID=UPI0012E2F2FD|nr:restriction endonuclease subunit S [Enterococcus faecalis]EKZ0408431.1 restriction endonuclease subunit S [Enterococcus faecalis]MUN83107.1 restriction endonuclease subunit S [Enterococcus faecalis]